MRFRMGATMLVVAGIMMAGCVDPYTGPNPVAILETNMGTIEIELWRDRAPVTVDNFIDLAEDGFYDGTMFHRIITGFMMQGGDPNTKDGDPSTWGQGGPGHTIPDEFHPDARHDRKGILSMANAGPNTGGSQFFITFGPTPHLDDKHSVFGVVISGMEVVDRVNAEASSQQGQPRKEVILEGVTIQYPQEEDTLDGNITAE